MHWHLYSCPQNPLLRTLGPNIDQLLRYTLRGFKVALGRAGISIAVPWAPAPSSPVIWSLLAKLTLAPRLHCPPSRPPSLPPQPSLTSCLPFSRPLSLSCFSQPTTRLQALSLPAESCAFALSLASELTLIFIPILSLSTTKMTISTPNSRLN